MPDEISPKRKIAGFHQDEAGDWVADLECGHTRHVRHNPPWMNRPWVTTPEGRAAHLGQVLSCAQCQAGRRTSSA
jgi:Protein of unknown function (DUF3565)